MIHNEVAKKDPKKNEPDTDNQHAAVKPDPETLHTTDPQEHMHGPISSLVRKAAENIEENDQEADEEGDEKK